MSVASAFLRATRACYVIGRNKNRAFTSIIYGARRHITTYAVKRSHFKTSNDQNISSKMTPYRSHFISFTPTIFTHQYKTLNTKPDTFEEQDLYLTNISKQLNVVNSNSDLSKICATFYNLIETLNQLRFQFNDDNDKWEMFIEFVHQHHPQLVTLCHQDPLTKRSYQQPRGYAGDAVTMDIIYKQSHNEQNVSLLGQHIFQLLMHEKSAEAVRERAQFIGKYIDSSYESKVIQLNVVNIACGHLREVESSRQFWKGNVKVFGIDQDAESLSVVKRDYIDKGYDVFTINGKITQLFQENYIEKLLSENDGMMFDLVWSAGLYDYLNDKSSKLLTKKLFTLIKPNGKLLIGNCLKNMSCGYMECFMNWTLIYRNIDEIRDFASEINPNEIQEIKAFEFECFAFIEITKK